MELSGLVVTNSISSTFQPALMATDLAPITELQNTAQESRGILRRESTFASPKKIVWNLEKQ